MKDIFQKIQFFLDNQNLSHTIIRLITAAILCSHMIGYRLWLLPDVILSPFTVPHVVSVLIFMIISVLCVLVIIRPKYAPVLITAMIVSALFNVHIITPFWVNYVLLLVFTRFDASLQLVVWLLGIQELWAGLNKFNGGYLNVINFFAEPFSKLPILAVIIGLLVLLIPLFEMVIGFGILFRKKFTPYLVLFVHGGALIMLSCFVHYGQIVWAWNVLIILLVWLLNKHVVKASLSISKPKLGIIILLTFVPFLQIITTLAYPFSYRMYTGNETSLLVDNKSYVINYYEKTKSLPFQSKETFKKFLRKNCNSNSFEIATITIPQFLSRKNTVETFTCDNNTLLVP